MFVIVDYGMGNLASVTWALDRLRVPSMISGKPEDIRNASALILPGVGSFRSAMENLHAHQLVTPLTERVVHDGIPFLGICLGMQLIASSGDEDGPTPGLGWIPGNVRKLPEMKLPVPHIGWNDITILDKEWLDHGGDSNYYFIHSYHFEVENETDIAAKVRYGEDWVAAVHRDNIFATQFHPEKSQDAGLKVLSRFMELNGLQMGQNSSSHA